ncbi:hypothetical protein [Desulfoferrobacter suflitae]|nr:hypothetical protein [Desulfoferrobacter suflitae]
MTGLLEGIWKFVALKKYLEKGATGLEFGRAPAFAPMVKSARAH